MENLVEHKVLTGIVVVRNVRWVLLQGMHAQNRLPNGVVDQIGHLILNGIRSNQRRCTSRRRPSIDRETGVARYHIGFQAANCSNVLIHVEDAENFSGRVLMFKRALQTNHWMAIGLEKWNKIESAEVPFTTVKKLREMEKLGFNSDDEEEVEDDLSNDESFSGSEDEIDSELSDEMESVDLEEDQEEETAEPESEAESVKESTSFEFCSVCPGKKFLTEADKEAHMKSAKHLKREKQETATSVTTPSAKHAKPEPRARQAPSENNRKARRAHLARDKQ